MQIRKSHRILAAVLTLVMLVGLLPTAAFCQIRWKRRVC